MDRSSFKRYSPDAAKLALDHLSILNRLPLAILPSILQQIVTIDVRFPAERQQLAAFLRAMMALSEERFADAIASASRIAIPPEVKRVDWINQPEKFIAALTPHLWSSGQIDAYRVAAQRFFDAVTANLAPPVQVQRKVLFVADDSLNHSAYPLFSKLRKHGLHLTNVHSGGDKDWPLKWALREAAQAPAPYAHWYLDGGLPVNGAAEAGGLTLVSYGLLNPVRQVILAAMERAIQSGTGPELLRTRLTMMRPSDCGISSITSDPLMQHFLVELFTQGSGTQVYSTTFVQWAAREILRRAQPKTLLVRGAPRVAQSNLNDLVSPARSRPDVDLPGSLIDVDMAAYYTWLELQKLAGASTAVFLAWFPGRKEAMLIAPAAPKGVVSGTEITIAKAYELAS